MRGRLSVFAHSLAQINAIDTFVACMRAIVCPLQTYQFSQQKFSFFCSLSLPQKKTERIHHGVYMTAAATITSTAVCCLLKSNAFFKTFCTANTSFTDLIDVTVKPKKVTKEQKKCGFIYG